MKKRRIKLIGIGLAVVIALTGCSAQTARRNFNKANDFYEKGNYEEANTYFAKAIDAIDDKAEYYIAYGFSLVQAKQYEEALLQFERVIMEKDIPIVLKNNKNAYRGIGITYYMMQDYNKAEEAFEKAIELKVEDDIDYDILSYQASCLENLAKYEEAIEAYTKLLEQKPKDSAIYNSRANIYRKLGDYESSIADYEKAIEYEKDNFDIYFGKYATLLELGKETEALDALDQASRIQPTSEKDNLNLAKVHFYQGNYESSKHEFEYALSNGFTEANYFLGEIALSEKDYEGALAYFLTYKESGNLLSATFYNELIVCYIQLGDFETAKTALETAKTYANVSINKQLTRNEIIILENLGDFSKALTLMEKYIKRYGEDEEVTKDYEFLKTRVLGEEQVEQTDTSGGSIVVKP